MPRCGWLLAKLPWLSVSGQRPFNVSYQDNLGGDCLEEDADIGSTSQRNLAPACLAHLPPSLPPPT